eukprot:8270311-Lingulodinium_polyedra.AAC.1
MTAVFRRRASRRPRRRSPVLARPTAWRAGGSNPLRCLSAAKEELRLLLRAPRRSASRRSR